ncbi:hypothetical protein [Thalassobaculum sp.]|uniref:hypothetical protein n=1 Tax=Thalassobaculum sp. TaxID=2022740 RepID=UPI003B5AFDDB
MRTLLRCLGWLFAALAAAFLTRDLYQLVDQGIFQPLSTGFVWFTLHPTSLQLAEAGISRHVSQFLWHPVISTILTWPAFAVTGGLAILFFLGGRKPGRPPSRSRSGEYFKQD